MNYFITALQKYAVFKGRARRSEYWYFTLFTVIIELTIGTIEYSIGIADWIDGGLFTTIIQLALLVPTYAVTIRRMHDVNKSGWYMLIPIYNFVLTITDGDSGTNNYGEDPKVVQF